MERPSYPTSHASTANIEPNDQLNRSIDYPDQQQTKNMKSELNTIKKVESKETEKVISIKSIESINSSVKVRAWIESIRDEGKIGKAQLNPLKYKCEIGDCYSLTQVFKIVFKYHIP